MNWIFPLAGKGKRTRYYGSFKPFINAGRKKIIEWFLGSIKQNLTFNSKLFFITTERFSKKFKFSINIKKILKKLKINNSISISLVKKTPQGPAITVKNIIYNIKNNKPCIIINADQFINFDLPKKIEKNKIYIPIYFNMGGNSSYVKFDKNGKIVEIKEKKLISFYASSGVYIFGSTKLLKDLFNKYKKKNNLKEINLSDVINYYLKINKFYAEPINTFLKIDLGDIKNIKKFTKLTNFI